MKVLLVPMSAMAETAGPMSRCRLIAERLKNSGTEVATCIARDVNYREIEDVKNYCLDPPMPLGLPEFIAGRTFPIAQKLGVTSHKRVGSFDEVLWLTGNLDYKYLKRSVNQILDAIDEFNPDAVYSEFNISAIIAAKKRGIRLLTTVSYPTRHDHAHNEKLSKGLNRLLAELSMDRMESALKLFDLAEKRFCFSIKELEPFDDPGVVFCGSLKKVKEVSGLRNKILVYMGNGTISANRMFKVIKEAFSGAEQEVFLASSYLKEGTIGNIHIAPRWDFDTLLDESVLFINHGGQNSMVDGLLHGVPQIVVPGKIFERRYNAEKLTENNAGRWIESNDFIPYKIISVAREVMSSGEMRENARALGNKLMSAGGIDRIIENMQL